MYLGDDQNISQHSKLTTRYSRTNHQLHIPTYMYMPTLYWRRITLFATMSLYMRETSAFFHWPEY